jgi:tetratricopeptide (TPR) repeat protein
MGKREQSMQAVQARLEQVASSGDLTIVLQDAALNEAAELAGTLTDSGGDLLARYLLGWLHWHRYQALHQGQDQQDLQAAAAMFTGCFISGMDGLPESLLPVLAAQAVPTAAKLLEVTQSVGDQELLSAVTELWERIVMATAPDNPSHGMYLSNLGIALLTRFQRAGAPADLDNAISAGEHAVKATPAGHPNHGMYLSNLGNALRARYERRGAQADLDNAISAGQQAVTATPADHPNHAAYLSNLGIALWARFGRTGAQADLDDAISAHQQVVLVTPAGHPNYARFLSNLGNALRTRYERSGRQADIEGAIQAGEQAVQATLADHPDHGMHLSNLGNALQTRFSRSGAQADLDRAIDAQRQAVAVTPGAHPSHAMYLANLGTALQARFRRTRAQGDLDTAVASLREAVQATPAGHPSRAARLSNLGNALWTQFERAGGQADLDNAIDILQEAAGAIPADHPDHATILSNLGNALRARHERTGRQADLDHAISAHQQAVEATPADHPDHVTVQSNLGIALHDRFERTGRQTDLDNAISALQQTAVTIPVEHPNRAGTLSNLGTALRARFERTGMQTDLNNAIDAHRQSVEATPPDHPSLAGRLSNLGIALRARFASIGAQADLDYAIDALQRAAGATPGDDPSRGMYLSNLGISLLTRFRRVERPADLDHAIDNLREATRLMPADHPEHAKILSNLGNALRTRYERAGSETDLDNAVNVLKQAIEVTPADHPSHATVMANLGITLRDRFEQTGLPADLDNAIDTLKQAAAATPADHPVHAAALTNLGDALQTRFKRTEAAADRDAAFANFAEAASVITTSASTRIEASRAGASLVRKTDPGRAAELLEAAVLLLPEVAPRLLERGDQQYAIGRFAGLAADAAALALSDPALAAADRPAKALRLLEAARGILLSQALSTRGNLGELRERHPELAAQFIELRDWLDSPPPVTDPGLVGLPSDQAADAQQRTIRDRRSAAAELTQLLDDIRAMDGFATFGLPPSAGQLQAQAAQGPVVVFNVSEHRSDAILLTGDGITSQPLPDLDLAAVAGQITVFYQGLRTIAASASVPERIDAQESVGRVLAWLWDTAVGPVLHTLGYRDQPPAGEPWPRAWWVPGGLLALLPIHAAGYHASPADPAHRAVIDRVLSSYTPTIGALAHARTQRFATVPSAPIRSLIIAMPTTPDLPDGGRLEYVPAEAALLQRRLPNPTLLSEPPASPGATDGRLPTKAAVLDHLADCAVAHFACHGSTNPADPSQSQLLLHDHRANPLTVAALAPVVLDHAQLAYLSACSTASVTNARLLDEAIHLASAFQLCGFPHVIGTLWEINDAIAVEIADAFYTALADPDGTIDPSRAASAIHQATRRQRDRWPANPYLWASHIHAGA